MPSCGCPEGYILNEDSGLCEKFVRETAVVNNSAPPTALVCGGGLNMINGTLCYSAITESQFPLIGQTNSPGFLDIHHTLHSPIARLFTGNFWVSSANRINGRFNMAGIKLSEVIDNWEGFSKCITVEEGDVISVGFSGTFAFRLIIDGILAIYYVPQLPVRLSDYYHVIPVSLEKGIHNFAFESMSVGIVPCGADGTYSGAFVCELYKNITPEILSELTTQSELTPYYATQNINGVNQAVTTLLLVGQPFDTGLFGKYSCSVGVINNCSEGSMVCDYYLTAPETLCCTKLTNCKTGVVILSSTHLPQYFNKIVVVAEHEGCFVAQYNETTGCNLTPPVTVLASFNDCSECTGVYYKLVDCNGVATSLYTDQDMSAYVGKVIKINGYDVCWTVGNNHPVSNIQTVVVRSVSNNCNDC